MPKFILRLLTILSLVAIIGCGWLYISLPPSSVITARPLEATNAAASGPEAWVLSLLLRWRADEITQPLSDDPTPIAFTIEPGTSVPEIAGQLQDLGFISDAQLFRRFLGYNGLDRSLEAGNYTLRRNMSLKDIALALQDGRPAEVVITLPEGWRAEQIADALTAENIMDGAAFLAVVHAGNAIDHPLLADRPVGQSYEGYLYPDTYRLPLDSTPEDLIQRMLDNLASKLPPNATQLAAQQNLSLYETLTVAAIVERESVVPDERPMIASVYLNRLKPDSPRNRLEADPTVQYAMGFQPETGQWWKTPVSLEEYAAVDSPYNTYLYAGLPPGPIANPGIASIMAVLQPAESDFYFFVCARPRCEGGEHVFAKTYEEHEANVARYYGQ